jgi:hypothetical protein
MMATGPGSVPNVALPSIRDVRPGEEGGPISRTGLGYQDEITAGFLIDMLGDPRLLRIHCETHDDIVLVRGGEDGELAEYVQVKAGEPDKLWSVSDICQRTGGKAGSSIFETSFEHDACSERSSFRLVTLRPVVSELKFLTFPIGQPGREPCGEAFLTLSAELHRRFPDIRSPKGNRAPFWIKHCRWEERHSEVSVRNENILRLLKTGIAEGKMLLPENAELLIEDLRSWISKAGAARWEPDRDIKIITRSQLREWWERRTREVIEGAASRSGGKLAMKMQDANVTDELINLALDLRRDYAVVARTSRFLDLEGGNRLQARVKSELASLRAKFVSGQLALDGVGFHSYCLERMDAINAERPSGTEDQSAFLKGCMYDITDRCLHRFARPS